MRLFGDPLFDDDDYFNEFDDFKEVIDFKPKGIMKKSVGGRKKAVSMGGGSKMGYSSKAKAPAMKDYYTVGYSSVNISEYIKPSPPPRKSHPYDRFWSASMEQNYKQFEAWLANHVGSTKGGSPNPMYKTAEEFEASVIKKLHEYEAKIDATFDQYQKYSKRAVEAWDYTLADVTAQKKKHEANIKVQIAEHKKKMDAERERTRAAKAAAAEEARYAAEGKKHKSESLHHSPAIQTEAEKLAHALMTMQPGTLETLHAIKDQENQALVLASRIQEAAEKPQLPVPEYIKKNARGVMSAERSKMLQTSVLGSFGLTGGLTVATVLTHFSFLALDFLTGGGFMVLFFVIFFVNREYSRSETEYQVLMQDKVKGIETHNDENANWEDRFK